MRNFVDANTRQFLLENGFALEEHIDPRVRRYFGTFLCEEARKLVARKFSAGFEALVWINCNDNSDFDCPATFRVEIGVKDDGNTEKNERTFGIFGSSSPFCASIDAAMREAALAFLFRFSEASRTNPDIVCWRRRDGF